MVGESENRYDVIESWLPKPRPTRVGKTLNRIEQLLDWQRFGSLLAKAYAGRGRPSIDPVLGFKALLLQAMYNLSFPELEEQLNDRDSFRRFVGLRAGEPVPDFSTFHKLRDRLQEAGLLDRLFDEVNDTLERHRLLVKQGTLIDATLIDSSRKQPPKEVTSTPEVTPEPPDTTPLPPRSQRDRDATVTKKRGRCYFGYKLHIAVDKGSWLIRQQYTTPANINDMLVAERLISGDEAAVYADRGFDSSRVRMVLQRLGIHDGIMRQNRNHLQITDAQKRINALIEPIRKPVERVFAVLKRLNGKRTARALTLSRNASDFTLWCTGYNLKRAAILLPG